MKNCTIILMALFSGIFLAGCARAMPAPTATIPAKIAAIQTIAVATAYAQITQTAMSSPTPKPRVKPTSNSKFTPPAIVLATLNPTTLPTLLQNTISVKTDESFEGHRLRRITGWQYGFAGFAWMDENHLLIHPVISAQQTGPTAFRFIGRPVVMRLNKNTIWFPPSGYETAKGVYFDSSFNRWSVLSSSVLIISERTSSDESIYTTYSLDGDLLKTYQGTLIWISPSGSKILLVVGNIFDQVNGTKTKWIDLLNNKEVIFDWQQGPDSYGYPAWSSDETKVYFTPYGSNLYGNAKTGENYRVSYTSDGEENAEHLIKSPYHSYGMWVLNDTYVLAGWNEHDEGIPGFLSFFDPAKKAYRNLSALAGLPYSHDVVGAMPDPPFPCANGQPIATPGGRYVWVNCLDGGRLIDMQTFKAKAYPKYPEALLKWSADGDFAFISNTDDGDYWQILSAASNQLIPIPTDTRCYAWHPKQNIFVYLYSDTQTLSIFDTHSMSIRQTVDLPTTFRCPVWNNRGNKLTMIAEDESLWQIDYPALNHLEQLTQPIKGIKDFIPSPDGTLIGFPIGPDIYIVDTTSQP